MANGPDNATATPMATPPPVPNVNADMGPMAGSTEDLENKGLASHANAAPAVSVVNAPDIVKPAKRGGLAGVMDDIANAIVGTEGPGRVYTDPKTGDEYIQHPTLSRKGQWLKIAGEALRGAAAGAAVGRGPGGAFRGAEAGIEAGDKLAQQQRENEQAQSAEVRQANQDRFNHIKLEHDKAMWAFEEAHAKQQGFDEEVKASRDEIEHEVKPVAEGGLGSQDLGVHANLADLAGTMSKSNPEFWKQVYGDTHGAGVVGYKEYDADGKVTGIHFFARTPGINQQLVPEDQATFRVYVPPKKEGESPTFETHKATVPMTIATQDALNSVAENKMSEWKETQRKAAHEEAETEQAKSAKTKNLAEAEEARARAKSLNEATSADAIKSNAQQMVDGDIDPSNLSKRSKSYDATLAAANAYSMQKYGKPFDLAQAASDYKFAVNQQTQSTLKLIRGMADPGGSIEIAQNAAKLLPHLPEATVNKVFNAVATEFGSREATDFHTAMLGLADEYSKVMGGGTATDTGRQQALNMLKASYSKGELRGSIDIMRKDIDARQKALVGTNRYLLRQYAPPRPQNVPQNWIHRDGPNGIGWYAP